MCINNGMPIPEELVDDTPGRGEQELKAEKTGRGEQELKADDEWSSWSWNQQHVWDWSSYGDRNQWWRSSSQSSADQRWKPAPMSSAFVEASTEKSDVLHQEFKWEAKNAPKQTLKKTTGVFFHGTYASLLPVILSEGLRPGLGAGSNDVMKHFGFAVPGVYVSPTWAGAAQYPLLETAGPISVDGCRYRRGVSGGALLAKDGTLPMRAVIRCVAKTTDRLWHRSVRKNKQSMFMTHDLHITHIYIYSVAP